MESKLIQIKKRRAALEEQTITGIRKPALALGPFSEMADLNCGDPLQLEIVHHGQSQLLKFCPFQEISLESKDMAQVQLLGVWKGWEIVDGKYRHMIFDDGDLCDAPRRFRFRMTVDSIPFDRPDLVGLYQFQAINKCDFHAILAFPSDDGLFDWTAHEGLLSPGVIGEEPNASQFHWKRNKEEVPPSSSCDCTTATSTDQILQNQMIEISAQLQQILSQERPNETKVLQEALEILDLSMLLLKQKVHERHPEFKEPDRQELVNEKHEHPKFRDLVNGEHDLHEDPGHPKWFDEEFER